MPSLETAARSLKVVLIAEPVHSDVEIETAITALGREPGGGLVVLPELFTTLHRAPIISAGAGNGFGFDGCGVTNAAVPAVTRFACPRAFAAARNNVPAVYGGSASARERACEQSRQTSHNRAECGAGRVARTAATSSQARRYDILSVRPASEIEPVRLIASSVVNEVPQRLAVNVEAWATGVSSMLQETVAANRARALHALPKREVA
jgi:hypothetical protein